MATLRRGKTAIEPEPEVSDIRELTRADLVHLTTKRPTNSIQTLRDNHHRVARAIASGMPHGQIAATCGISYNRISVLKADPAFAELVAHYRAVLTAEWSAEDPVIEYMRTNAVKAQAMLSDKLDAAAEANEFLPTRDLVAISELGLDRTGYGKVNKNVNINVDFAAKLEQARTRSARARVIEGTTPQSVPASPDRISGLPTSGPSLRRL